MENAYGSTTKLQLHFLVKLQLPRSFGFVAGSEALTGCRDDLDGSDRDVTNATRQANNAIEALTQRRSERPRLLQGERSARAIRAGDQLPDAGIRCKCHCTND
jgi:hypothetical protein